MKLFLDDIRKPSDCLGYMHRRIGQLNPLYDTEWTVVRNYKEFCHAIDTNVGRIAFVSFDHDLADKHYHESMFDNRGRYEYEIRHVKEETGKECAEYMVKVYTSHNLSLPACFIHTQNPVGLQRIKDVLDDYKKRGSN